MFESNLARFFAENNVKTIKILSGGLDIDGYYKLSRLRVEFNSGFTTELTGQKLRDLLK